MCQNCQSLEKPPAETDIMIVFPFQEQQRVETGMPYSWEDYDATLTMGVVKGEKVEQLLLEMNELEKYKNCWSMFFMILFMILIFPVGIVLLILEDTKREKQLRERISKELEILDRYNAAIRSHLKNANIKDQGWQWQEVGVYQRRRNNEPNFFVLKKIERTEEQKNDDAIESKAQETETAALKEIKIGEQKQDDKKEITNLSDFDGGDVDEEVNLAVSMNPFRVGILQN